MEILGISITLAFLIIVGAVVVNRFEEYRETYKKNRLDFWVATFVCLFFVMGVAMVIC